MSAQPALALRRTVALVGLMGAGKSSIGRRLAVELKLPFVDADAEIEEAAGQSIEEIFERQGEVFFRAGERRVVARLLEAAPHVLAAGGGAFMDPETRRLMRERAITVWIKADIDTLLARVARRNNRPLLKQGDRRATLERLAAERHPVYAEAALAIDSGDGPPEELVARLIMLLRQYCAAHPDASATAPAP
jgi:shikimate kinase